jgi:hypothetical protein
MFARGNKVPSFACSFLFVVKGWVIVMEMGWFFVVMMSLNCGLYSGNRRFNWWMETPGIFSIRLLSVVSRYFSLLIFNGMIFLEEKTLWHFIVHFPIMQSKIPGVSIGQLRGSFLTLRHPKRFFLAYCSQWHS